jgi:hypothetical protein
MTYAAQKNKFRARNRAAEILGMINLNKFIILAINSGNRNRNLSPEDSAVQFPWKVPLREDPDDSGRSSLILCDYPKLATFDAKSGIFYRNAKRKRLKNLHKFCERTEDLIRFIEADDDVD